MHAPITTAILERQRAREIVETTTRIRASALEGFRLLDAAKRDLGALLGAGYAGNYADHLWESRISDGRLMEQAEKTDQLIATNTWKYLLQLFGLYQYMTEARRKECAAQLQRGEFPALTVLNISATLEGLTQDMGGFLLESVHEVVEWLRPRSHHGAGALKTNTRFRVGYAVILTGVLHRDQRVWGLRTNGFRDNDLRALGKVLALLDGQGVPQYPHDLVTQLNEALKDVRAGDLITLPYMQCRPRKNGNLAVRFTRYDLIDRLNQLGADGRSLAVHVTD